LYKISIQSINTNTIHIKEFSFTHQWLHIIQLAMEQASLRNDYLDTCAF